MADAQAKACPVPEWGEPWTVHEENIPLADTGDFMGLVEVRHSSDVPGRRVVFEIHGEDEIHRKVADRIVSCVNALAGLSPEALPEFIKAAASLAGVIEEVGVHGGVHGYHLNGDLASWSEVGGDEFLDALAKLRGEVTP